MGFAEDVESILQQLPEQRQIALFSATLPEPIRRIAQQYLRQPAEITIRQKTATADTVRQRFLVVAPQHKNAVLSRVLESEPIDGVIVFVKLRSSTEPLAEYLAHQGHRAAALHGEMPQKQRERIIDQLRSGKVNIVVATDVAARGLDVQRISHVLNFDLPLDSEAYVHRIGRTGRAGRSGEAILFVSPRQQRLLTNLERATRQPVEPMALPTNRTINKQRVAKFHERITAALSHPEVPAFESIVEQYRRSHDVPLEKIAAALAVLAAGEKPLLLKDELPAMGFERGPDRRRPPSAAGPRGERTGRQPGPRRSREGLETFRLEVGAVHQVTPGHIVGAIANEAQLDGAAIGRIQIFDEFTTVDLPIGMPPEIFHQLKKVWVVGRQLNISRVASAPPQRARRDTRTAEHPPRTKKRPGKSK
jgi:ATP-dependent RNA helicase DeaD